MLTKIQACRTEVAAALAAITSSEGLKEFYARFLGKSGAITALMKDLGTCPKEDRPAMGKAINDFKGEVLEQFNATQAEITAREMAAKYDSESVDITMPAVKRTPGAIHPTNLTRRSLCETFIGMGFTEGAFVVSEKIVSAAPDGVVDDAGVREHLLHFGPDLVVTADVFLAHAGKKRCLPSNFFHFDILLEMGYPYEQRIARRRVCRTRENEQCCT